MDLFNYLNRNVYLTILNGYYYRGLVLAVDENSLTLRDKNGRLVTLKNEVIVSVTEVSQ